MGRRSERPGGVRPGSARPHPVFILSPMQPASLDDSPPPLDAEAVQHVARLSRLAINDAEAARYAAQLAAVLGYIDTLREVDVSDVQPLLHPLDLSNVLRTDDVEPAMPRDAALRNAPAREGDFFAVPKVLDGGGA